MTTHHFSSGYKFRWYSHWILIPALDPIIIEDNKKKVREKVRETISSFYKSAKFIGVAASGLGLILMFIVIKRIKIKNIKEHPCYFIT